MKAEPKKWLDAVIVLGRELTARVWCPVCEHEYLAVRDVYPTPDSDVFERYLECPNCRSRNLMRMKRSSALPTSAMLTSGNKSETQVGLYAGMGCVDLVALDDGRYGIARGA